MKGRFDWVGSWFAMHGRQHTASSFISKADQIMSKYRPIAPKPTLHMPANLCKSTASVLDFSSALNTTHKENSIAKSGHSRNGNRRRGASDCPSPRVLKKPRPPTVDRPNLVCSSDRSFSAGKDSVVMKKAADPERSLLQTRSEGLLKTKAMDGEVGVENPATNMEAVAVPRMSESQCASGSAQYFVFPIVSDIQQQLQEVEKNPVTLPLLPQIPLLQRDSDLGSLSSTSSAEKDIRLRVFGTDLSHEAVGASHESPKLGASFVPNVGLSFL